MIRILIQVDTRHAASREMISGVLRFATTHREVEVQFAGAHPSSAPVEVFRSWKPDALIADATVHALSPDEFSALSGRAVIFVNTPPRKNCRKPYARLTTDDRALALAATKLFTDRKLHHFAYVGTPGLERWSEARERIFRAALRDRGHALEVFRSVGRKTWRDEESALADWLLALPKPCGVWAAYDQRAKHVLDACRLAGIDVPGQIQVLGVDNEPFICEQTLPSLSSVAPDFEAGGYAAAAYATDVLTGRAGELRPRLVFSVRGIIERLSTADANGHARHVATALEFIRKNAIYGIGVGDVAAAVGVSVRLLQRDFPLVTGTTVVNALIDARLTRAKTLLKKSATPLDEIARLSGFANPTHMMTIFKRRTGMTMNTYRANGQ